VHSTKDIEFFGDLSGIVTLGKLKIEIDYFKVFQESSKINLIKEKMPKVEKVFLNDSINSIHIEKSPKLSPDGKTLYFSRESINGSINSNIYYAKKDSNNQWGPAIKMDPPLNNSGNNALISITSDETTCLLMNTYNSNGTMKGSGISMSRKSNNKWEVPKDVKIIDFHNNSNFNEYHLSADGNILIITLERNETQGLKDIYVCFKIDDSTFSKPKNLGPTVNTFADETGAFLAPDLTTLYYSTSGFKGYGSNDIYMTKRLDSSWTNWTEPVNLGPYINSDAWDAYLTVDASGVFAYMTNSRKETNLDILKFELPEILRPDPVCLVKGRILDTKTKQPINAKVEYKDLKTNKIVGTANSDDITGDFQIILLRGKKYAFNAQENGYYPISQNIDLTKIDSYKEIYVDLLLTPIEKGAEIILNNLFFEYNKTDLIDDSFAELDNLIIFLKENIETKIDIIGYTDNRGNDSYNINLSKQRADEVKKYLISKGINETRLTTIGKGKANPIVNNDTEENRAKNRRVEFQIK
jgi:outer membrane protein OmpA-like peptidoglycan-associated protein